MRRINIPDVNTPANYDEIYFGWRTVQLPAHEDILKLLKALNTGGNVLDIGCGLGRYFPAFEGCKIYGTEMSPKAREYLKTTFPEAEIKDWIGGDKLPFENGFFNLIWAGEILEHLKDPQQLVDEVHRVLAMGGTALFTTPVGTSSECPEHLWFFDRKDIDGLFWKYEKHISLIRNDTRFQIILRKHTP